jgi:hypothetical protein
VIKPIQINVGKKLTGEVANGQAARISATPKTHQFRLVAAENCRQMSHNWMGACQPFRQKNQIPEMRYPICTDLLASKFL